MCDSFQTMAQPAWASSGYTYDSTSQSSRRGSPSCPGGMPIGGGGRRGAVVAYSSAEQEANALESIRRGSISTCLRSMQLDSRPQYQYQLPVPPVMVVPAKSIASPPPASSSSYYQAILSPPSSPRSAPKELTPSEPQSASLYPSWSSTKHDESSSFQSQVMSRLQSLGHSSPAAREDDKLTPPPSPRPFPPASLPIPSSSLSSRRTGVPKFTTNNGKKQKARSAITTPLASPSSLLPPPLSVTSSSSGSRSHHKTLHRRVSVPANLSSLHTSATASHTSSRGAVKKCTSSSAANSRRGSSKGLEILLEGTLFKSGWSWDTAYGKGQLDGAMEEEL